MYECPACNKLDCDGKCPQAELAEASVSRGQPLPDPEEVSFFGLLLGSPMLDAF